MKLKRTLIAAAIPAEQAFRPEKGGSCPPVK